MTLAFIAAESREFTGLLRHATGVRKLSWPLQYARGAELRGRDVVMLANGPGPRLAAAAAEEAGRQLLNLEAFVSVGYCGALDNKLRPVGIVIASDINGSRVTQPDVQLAYTAGPFLSRDAVACTVEEKSRLRKSGAIAVEMEAAGVEEVARRFGVPFYCIRVVTDAASETLALDFNRMRGEDGRFSRARILAAACRNPRSVIPALMSLERTCRSASLALGEFIANCRF